MSDICLGEGGVGVNAYGSMVVLQVKDNGYEVVFCTEPLDELCVMELKTFQAPLLSALARLPRISVQKGLGQCVTKFKPVQVPIMGSYQLQEDFARAESIFSLVSPQRLRSALRLFWWTGVLVAAQAPAVDGHPGWC